ncbi:tetratricopeptide repeat protein [Streptomyces tendae]
MTKGGGGMGRWFRRGRGDGRPGPGIAVSAPCDNADGEEARVTDAGAGGSQAPVHPAAGTWQEVTGSGNATATHGGKAVTGIDNSITLNLPPEARPPTEVPTRAGLDAHPFHPGLFVGRGGELEELDAALEGVALVQAVSGLGGIGKSTLVAHWAATRAHGYVPVRWFTADSPAGVQQGLADLAVALQPLLARVLPVEALAEWGMQWLACHTGWLVVLDNVQDPADIAALVGRASGGRFLITSRLTTGWSAAGASTVVRLDVLDPGDSLKLLTRIAVADHPGRDMSDAAGLCEELGHLPLAVEQAGAYLAQNPFITPRAYRELLARQPGRMLGRGAVNTPAERTIARIWDVTLDRVSQIQPEAASLLRVLAWFAPDHIPTALLPATEPGQHDQAGADGGDGRDGGGSRSRGDGGGGVWEGAGVLSAYGMLTVDPAAGTVSVHRLVQAVARTPEPGHPHRTLEQIEQARQHATSCLHTALPQDWNTPASWPLWRELLPHVDALARHADTDTDTYTTARLLSYAGGFLNDQGTVRRAIAYLLRAHTTCLRVVGEDHLDTLSSRNNLAEAYRAAGDLARAIPLFERTLRVRVRVLGEDHPDTLTSRNNLAYAYETAGDLARAIPLFERTLDDAVRVLGEDHLDTLSSRNNLAGAYRAAGDLARAIPLFERTLRVRARVLGEDHPDTLTSRNNLAGAYRAAGDLARAIPLFERTLRERVRVLGEDHPSTLTSRNNLACTYETAGDLARAIPLYEQTLRERVRVLGEDHPSTLTSRNNLAYAYETAGDLARAIPLYEQTLRERVRVLGEDHPDTLSSRNNLACAYQSAGDLERAVPLFEQTVDDAVRVLGNEHPTTRTVQTNLAHARLPPPPTSA